MRRSAGAKRVQAALGTSRAPSAQHTGRPPARFPQSRTCQGRWTIRDALAGRCLPDRGGMACPDLGGPEGMEAIRPVDYADDQPANGSVADGHEPDIVNSLPDGI